MGFSWHDNRLVTPAAVEVGFAYRIMRVVEDGDQCYVFVDPPEGVVFNDNVFCIGVDGRLRWQVENKLKGTELTFYDGAFVKDGKLTLYNVDGFAVLVDRNDGRVLDFVFDKGVGYVW
jgi:hypothetical protein